MSREEILKWLAEVFDAPCNYTFNGIDVAEYMFDNCPEWCEKNCSNMKYDKCWDKYFEILGGKK